MRHCCEGSAFSHEDALRDALTCHMAVATNTATHLQLVFENVMRTSWLAGAVLSPDAAAAQRAARELHDKLIRTHETAQTTFEKAVVADGRLEMLAAFVDRPEPVVLWRDGGRYAALFRWLAVRFLGNPDHVLECESVHAQWQWIEAVAHNIKMKQLNAQLAVRAWLQQHHDLPSHEDLIPYIDAVQEDARRRYAIVAAGEAVAEGHRAEHLYLERFNLTAADAVCLGARRHARTSAPSATTAFRNYFAGVLSPGSFYSVEGLRPSLFFSSCRTSRWLGGTRSGPTPWGDPCRSSSSRRTRAKRMHPSSGVATGTRRRWNRRPPPSQSSSAPWVTMRPSRPARRSKRRRTRS